MLSGLAWTIIGIVLIVMALEWLISMHRHTAILVATGVIAGVLIYRFGFSRLALGNLARIKALAPEKDKLCLFAFQNRRSYVIIVIMMFMGYELRHSPIPKTYLIPLYAAIGLALVFSSFHYYQGLH